MWGEQLLLMALSLRPREDLSLTRLFINTALQQITLQSHLAYVSPASHISSYSVPLFYTQGSTLLIFLLPNTQISWQFCI